jgi:Mce-associated membrane protein
MAVKPDSPDVDELVDELVDETTEVEDPDVDDTPETAEADEVEEVDGNEGRPTKWRALRRLSNVGWALVASVAVIATLAGLGGWMGYRAYEKQEAHAKRDLFVQTARQGAVNLTTINYAEVETDVQRVLDSATGAFHEDFAKRSQPFIEIIKAARSQSEGTITEAGLESERGDSAQVLVAVSVKSRTAVGEQTPREWRMRIEVQAVGDGAKVSNVVFVP